MHPFLKVVQIWNSSIFTEVFNNRSSLHQHLKTVHGLCLEPWSKFDQATPVHSAVRGALEVYEMEGNGLNDVLSFVHSTRYQIKELKPQKTIKIPQKVDLSLSISLTKGVYEYANYIHRRKIGTVFRLHATNCKRGIDVRHEKK